MASPFQFRASPHRFFRGCLFSLLGTSLLIISAPTGCFISACFSFCLPYFELELLNLLLFFLLRRSKDLCIQSTSESFFFSYFLIIPSIGLVPTQQSSMFIISLRSDWFCVALWSHFNSCSSDLWI